MHQAMRREAFSRQSSDTEEAMMGAGSSVEVFDGDGVEKKKGSISRTRQKEKEVYDTLTMGESRSDVEALHFHPVLNGQVNLHPSPEDLETRKHQKETYGIQEQWIVGFDQEPPHTMRRVKYDRDGTMMTHNVDGTEVKVSRIQKDGTGDGRLHDVTLEDTRNLQNLEALDKKKEIEELTSSL